MGAKIIIEKNIDIPMRDGCVLRGDLYRPDGPEKLPVLLNRTPYDKILSVDLRAHARRHPRGAARLQRGLRRLPRHASPRRALSTASLTRRRTATTPSSTSRKQPWADGKVGTVRGVLHGRDAMAGGDAESAEPESDGASYHGERLPRRLDLPGRRLLAVLQRELADDHDRVVAPDARAGEIATPRQGTQPA